ncbi:MAG: RluA family pseudouridine synthase [Hyphomicrobiales bacterium]|jgi:23S rRNA pseudouridine955/2504/2580 synthase|nr:RluA family pseudouridine synthase [Hyphomicrobiales bacterium]MDG1523542.1 RluA family pseudouridine synthase [Hyphomicrobiales bacterium]MDG1664555.1 RluA family pseudouridine synthase [Hyphomicrobiales bacterium]
MIDLREYNIETDFSEARLDRWISHFFSKISHNNLEKLLRKGIIKVNGKKVKSSFRLNKGDIVTLPNFLDELASSSVNNSQIPGALDFIKKITIFQNEEILILNKPFGLAVQGGTGIENHLDGYLKSAFFNSSFSPRLVHRLDKETTGVLVVALTRKIAVYLSNLFQERKVNKTYWAITDGSPALDKGDIDFDIKVGEDNNHLNCLTRYYKVLNLNDKICWIAFQPVTGRTHQIRQHASMSSFPIVGDKKYGRHSKEGLTFKKLHLHSRSVDFMNVNGDILHFEASLPKHMKETWKKYNLPLNPNIEGFTVRD